MRARRPLLVLLLLLLVPALVEGTVWGWLGVRIRDLSEQEMEEISSRHGIREGYGALIVEVLKETPAARAGLKNGDLVVAFGSRPVVDTRALQRFVAGAQAGEEAVVTVLRDGEGRRSLRVKVGLMPRDVAAERIAAEFGFVVRDRPEEREELARPSGTPVIAFVLRGSLAERAGLKPGDVILEVNGRPVLSRQAASEALGETTLDQPLRLVVQREAERLRLTLPPAGNPGGGRPVP